MSSCDASALVVAREVPRPPRSPSSVVRAIASGEHRSSDRGFPYPDGMDLIELGLVTVAMDALDGPGHPIAGASDHVPNVPGLYSIHAKPETWRELRLPGREPGIPLYVGKAEDSLVTRELKTHFAVGRGATSTTGSSTVRRSFAALLREALRLRAIPRNLDKLGYYSNYSLEPDGDARLTEWMHANLTLAVWPMPPDAPLPLRAIEKGVLARWNPPLNLTDVAEPSQLVKLSRRVMAEQARTWGFHQGKALSSLQ